MKFPLVMILFGIIVTSSCGYEFDFSDEINARNFKADIDENAADGTLIGTLVASSSFGRMDFEIVEQTPEGAFSLDHKNCEISVAKSSAFDFETNPEIVGRIAVSNKNNADTVWVNINVLDVDE